MIGVPETRHALEAFHTLRYTGTLDTIKCGSQINLSDVLPLLTRATLADPEITLRYYNMMRNIRRRKEGSTISFLRQSRRIHEWLAEPHSSLLLVKGSFRTRHMLRDFTADMIDLLRKEKTIVAWVLQPKGERAYVLETGDVLRQLVSQILPQSPVILNELSASLVTRRVRDTSTVDDWFSLLGSVLVGLKQVYLVIDTEVLADQAQEYKWSCKFARLFDDLQARQIRTTVKVVFFTCRKPIIRHLQAGYETVIDAGSSQAVTRLQSRPLRTPRQATNL